MKLIQGLGMAAALSACDVHIDAIDFSKSGASHNSLHGGCTDPVASGTAASSNGTTTPLGVTLIGVTIDKKATEEAVQKGKPLDSCIEKVGGIKFSPHVDSLTSNNNCGASGTDTAGPSGTMDLDSLVLTADKGPATFSINCNIKGIPISGDGSQLAAAASSCANDPANTPSLIEFFREALNAKAEAITFTATAGCDPSSCFNIAYTMKVRISDVTLGVGKSCTPKR